MPPIPEYVTNRLRYIFTQEPLAFAYYCIERTLPTIVGEVQNTQLHSFNLCVVSPQIFHSYKLYNNAVCIKLYGKMKIVMKSLWFSFIFGTHVKITYKNVASDLLLRNSIV